MMTLRIALTAAALGATSGTWVLQWQDDFDGPVVNQTNWNVLANVSEGSPPSWNQIELYTADNVYTDIVDGRSVLVLRTQPQNVTWQGQHYNVTSGRVDSSGKVNVTYGRVEVNARLQNDAASGIHTAHWLLGYDCWPKGAEIDIMESQSPGGIYAPEGTGAQLWQHATSAYHWAPETGTCGKDTQHTTGGSYYPHAPTSAFNYTSDFTTFAVEWNNTDLVYYINQTVVNHVYNGMPGWAEPVHVPSWPMYIILSQAFMAKRPLGNPPQWAWPVRQYIDFVRVYEWVPNAENELQGDQRPE